VGRNALRISSSESPLAGLVTFLWALGALASVALVVKELPYAIFLDAISSGSSPLYFLVGLLLVQAFMCLASMLWWRRVPTKWVVVIAAAVIAAHAGLAGVVWGAVSTELWLLWVGPVPFLMPAAAQLLSLAAGSRFHEA
jgi:hypothetical protein